MRDARALAAGNVDGAVARPAIDHDTLIAKGQRVEAGADIRRLIAGDDDR